ncbi:MAG: hypothetical protein ACKVS5_16040 [Parvularculaceae bacterium]
MVHLSPDLPLTDAGTPPSGEALPLLVCWAIWLTASAALWLLALRAAVAVF